MPSLPFALLDRWMAPAPDPRKVAWIGAQDYAHRGLHFTNADTCVPENSRAAFAQAIAQGQGIELDVQRSRDGQPVVFHDDELDRLTGETGVVSRRTAAQLAAIPLCGTDETIPTLRQVLDQIGGKVPVLIEIKSDRSTKVPALCLAVRRVLEGYTGAHAVMSFDPRVASWYRHNSTHTIRGLIVSEGDTGALIGTVKRRLALWHAKPDFMAYDVRDLPSRFAAAQRRRGLPLTTWTVRDADHDQRAEAYADAAIFEVGADFNTVDADLPGNARVAAAPDQADVHGGESPL